MAVLGVILRVFLKLVTCIIGGGLAAWIVVGGIASLFFSRHRPSWERDTQVFALYVGLLCGIAWAIENNKARWRFFWSSSGGVSVGWVVHLATGNASVCWAFILLGLFVGVVSALASVGAYGRK